MFSNFKFVSVFVICYLQVQVVDAAKNFICKKAKRFPTALESAIGEDEEMKRLEERIDILEKEMQKRLGVLSDGIIKLGGNTLPRGKNCFPFVRIFCICFNPSIAEFVTWTYPPLYLVVSIV